MVSIDGHMHLCDSSSRQFRIVLKPLEHILTMWLYQYLSLFKHLQSKLFFQNMFTSSSRHLCPSGVSSHPPSGISAQAPGPGRWVAPLDSKGSTCAPDSVTQSMSKKLGQENLQALTKCIWSSTKEYKRQSNSIKFTRFFRSMTVRDFSPFLPPPVAAVPSQEAFLYQTEEPKKNQQSGRSTDCGGQGKIFHKICVYIYI